MRCPICGNDETRVIDSRPAEQGSAIRRRRSCGVCGHRFTTYERNAPVLLVKKRSGRLEPFAPEKLQTGVEAALADRPVRASAISDLLEDLESVAANHAGPISSEQLGRLVLDRLRVLDEVAYLRFASVYKGFQGAEDFGREVAALETASDTKRVESSDEPAPLGVGRGEDGS
ncbi:MAG TPA: transcriptional regulator NrdR [Acidimicrobiia bacterium]|nr:transcriptional regulator NrdR [Acidimicrobiia bacterium]